MKNNDSAAERITNFISVLKLVEDELFGDAFYEINYRKNVKGRKPIELPNEEDVQILIDECEKIMSSTDVFDYSAKSYVPIRSATATFLIIFNARRGGEPTRLAISQWEEALRGEWVDRDDLPNEYDDSSVLVTYQTGKGVNHLVPVMFPAESHKALRYLADKDVRSRAGILPSNDYLFPSTQNSPSHSDGWHCINDVLMKLDKKGAINATANRHRVATILARLSLTEMEKDMIFKHFGHSKSMNENRYVTVLYLITTSLKRLKLKKKKTVHE